MLCAQEIFELLWLLSRASCGQNRARVLDIVVGELWLLALSWDGIYSDEKGRLQLKRGVGISPPAGPSAKMGYPGYILADILAEII